MEALIKFFSETIRPLWHKPVYGIGFCLLCGIGVYVSILTKTGNPGNLAGILAALGSSSLLLLFWFGLHAIPRCPSTKIGIVLAIAGDSEAENNQIQTDFVRELKTRLLQEQEAANFQVILLPAFAINQVIHENKAFEYLTKARGHLMLFGFARSRMVDGKDAHILQLEGIVRHAPLPKETVQRFAKEFGEVLPRRLLLPKDGDIFAFEISSEWTDLGVRHVIAIAAHLSGDFVYAEQLYLAVENRIKRRP